MNSRAVSILTLVSNTTVVPMLQPFGCEPTTWNSPPKQEITTKTCGDIHRGEYNRMGLASEVSYRSVAMLYTAVVVSPRSKLPKPNRHVPAGA